MFFNSWSKKGSLRNQGYLFLGCSGVYQLFYLFAWGTYYTPNITIHRVHESSICRCPAVAGKFHQELVPLKVCLLRTSIVWAAAWVSSCWVMLSSILPCRERVFSAQMIESIVHMIYGATELVFGAGDRTESPKIGSTGKRWGPVWRASCLTEIRVGCKVDTADPAKQNQVEKNTAVTLCPCVLVGGLEHDFFFPYLFGKSSSQLTNSYFSEG